MAQAYRVRSRIARLIVRGLFAAIFRVRHDGTLPARGPLLVVANHQGWADGFLLAASFPLSADVRLLGDREGTGKVWWWRAVLRAVGIVIPIERASASADRAAITTTLAALESGAIVVVFAEGRVSRVESSLGPFARGVGYLALRSGAPILPVWLSGTAELYFRKELVTIAGAPRTVPPQAPTKDATRTLGPPRPKTWGNSSPPGRAPDPAPNGRPW